MLSHLHVSNYALIDELEIDFGDRLNIVTGETGAGKSIILGAISLLLGDRLDAKTLRDDKRKMVVEATFVGIGADVARILEAQDIDHDGRECILRRELTPSARTRVFVNDTPATLALLREVATRLLDIHSQHSNMLLAKPAFQLSVIDSLADNLSLRQEYAVMYQRYQDTRRRLEQATDSFRRAQSEEDYIRFQYNQLSALSLRPGEDKNLEAERDKLSHVTDIKQTLWQVDSLFNAEQGALLDNLRGIVSRLAAIEPMMTQLQGMSSRVEEAMIELKDIAGTLNAVQEELQLDPDELARVEQRLDEIYALEQKHQAHSVDELIAICEDFRHTLEALDNSGELIEQLTVQLRHDTEQATSAAQALTRTRQEAAKHFERQLTERAASLAMGNLRFQVAFNAVNLQLTGCDDLQFLIAFNKNQALMPVRDTASGGEISRVMLCIKAICADHVDLPTLILDEVDTGVSGDTAAMMGEMMGDIARTSQVIAITHLPQVAAQGHHHYKVFKTDTDDRTVTGVTALDDEQHVIEIARMLSGKDINQAALDNARALIKQNFQP